MILNLDYQLQKQAFNSLKEGIEKFKASGGVAVFQEVETGRVLALVSLPSFDNNQFARGINKEDLTALYADASQPLFNRAVSGTYPAGSTVKPLVGAAALEEGLISEKTLFNDTGVIAIGEYRFPDWKVAWGLPPNGPINIIEALSQSCDTFFYAVGGGYGNQAGLGIDRLQDYGKRFGFSQKTQIDIPGEEEGLYPSPKWKKENTGENWYLGDTYWVAIGQSYVLTTPIQINNYINAVANGGILYRPLIVQKIVDLDRQVIKEYPSEVLNRDFISQTSLDIIKEGMRKSVREGIIWPLRETEVSIAAKTGTAEFGEKNIQGYYKTHAWVTGFFPAGKPEVSFTILLESGGKSNNAAQVARDIINWYYERAKTKE